MGKTMLLTTVVAASALLSACYALNLNTSSNYSNSSVVDFLYPMAKESPRVQASHPRLRLPIKVGVAFTPHKYGYGFAESHKIDILREVGARFEKLEYVDSIKIIPATYLRPAGGFENLDQLKRLLDIDVVSLVSFDQTTHTDEGMAAIAYWTIIGAYIIPAEKNATHTLMDAVVYDINSRSLLFRAAGTSSVKSSATLVNNTQAVREDSIEGLQLASTDLTKNLQVALENFGRKLKEEPQSADITYREGYTGSGSSSIALRLCAGLLAWRNRKQLFAR